MKLFIFYPSFSFSGHRLLRRTLVLSVILFGRNKPQRTGVKGVYAELLSESSASLILSGKKN